MSVPAANAPLQERDAELATIAAHLDAAVAGRGSLLVAEGPAGIGKTRLMGAAAEAARERGIAVLRARGGVLEQPVEYGLVRQLVEREIVQAPPERQAELLAGPAAPAAAVLGVGAPGPDPGPGRDPSPEILHALHWVVVNLAEAQPLFIAVDDAQWGDSSSLRAGSYLANRLAELPVAVMVCVREDKANPYTVALTELLHASDPVYLRPAPLGEAGARGVLANAFGVDPPEELVTVCLRVSGGVPFFLTELAAELAAAHPTPAEIPAATVADAGPEAVRRSLLLRLGQLGEGPTRLAQAVATLGGEGQLRHAAAVAGLDPDEAAEAADRLIGAQVLADERPLRLIHPLVHAAIAEQASPSERAAAHRRAFEVLRADGEPDERALPHALEARPSGDAELVGVLRRGAERALRGGAPDAAADHLRRALEEPPSTEARPEVLAELGTAEVRMGDFDAGLGHLEAAMGGLGDPAARITAQRSRMFAAFAGAGMGAARELVRQAAADARAAGDEGALELEADLSLLAWLSGGEHGLELERHSTLAGRTAAERTILAVLAQETHSAGRDPAAAVELAERALGGGRLIAEDTAEALSWYMATYTLLSCEANDAARTTIDAAIADARRRGSAFAHAGALGARAVLALNQGRPRDAEADARTAAEGEIPPVMRPVNAAYLVLALVDQGDADAAEAELTAAGIDTGPGGPTVLRWIPWARARLREAQGSAAGAREAIAPLAEDDAAGGPMRALAWRALLARVLARSETEEAAGLAREHLAWAEGWGRPAALGVAIRAEALTLPAERAIERLAEAADVLAGSDLSTEEARARADLGIRHLRAGSRRAGREELERAQDVAIAAGARGVAAAVAGELEVAGGTVRRVAFDELTASERRVAELAASGRTNREIADELFVTPKTVENHLTRVYSKLSLSSRRELTGAL